MVARAAALAAVVLLSACTDTDGGGSNCGPQRYGPGPGVAIPEVRGISSRGQAYALVPEYPLIAGQPTEIHYKLTAAAGARTAVRLEAVGFGPPGEVGDAAAAQTRGWERPGPEWAVTVTVPRAGCWILRATAEGTEGSFTLRVRSA